MTAPRALRAQQRAMPVIGFLGGQTPELFASRLCAFRQGLAESGHIEGRNVAIEYRWAQGQDDRLPALAADLVHRQVAAIATSSTSSAVVAKASTKTIPTVFAVSSDPVQLANQIARLRMTPTTAAVVADSAAVNALLPCSASM